MNEYDKFIDIELTNTKFGITRGSTSRVVAKCQRCNSNWDTSIRSIQQTLKKRPDILCHSCVSERNWEVASYRNNMDKAQKSHEHRQSQREKSIKFNNDNPHYILMFSEKSTQTWMDPDHRKKMSFIQSDPSYVKNQSEKMLSVWNQDGYRDNQSKKHKDMWDDDIFYNDQIKQRNTDSHKKKMSDISTKLWQSPEFRLKNAIGLENYFKSGKDSILEKITQGILDSLNIQWVRQHRIGPWSFDLYLPLHNVLIEVQGGYSHSYEKAKIRDASKLTYINSYFPQYGMLYLYERDFMNPLFAKDILVRKLNLTNVNSDSIDFNMSDVYFNDLSDDDILPNSYYSTSEEFLQTFHQHGYGRSAYKIYGAYLKDQLIGVCKYSRVKKDGVAKCVSRKRLKTLELDRICIHPKYENQWFLSYFISKCSKLVFESSPKIYYIVSLNDTVVDHLETENWTHIGVADPFYYYVNDDGWVTLEKTLIKNASKSKMDIDMHIKSNNMKKMKCHGQSIYMMMRK